MEFHLPHVHILRTHHCNNKCHEAFKLCEYFQDMLCHCYDAELVAASFLNPIQSEYYCGNIYVYI